MKILCNKDELSHGLSIVNRAISSRTTMPVLEGIYMETEENAIKLTCTDMTIGIETRIEAKVLEEGQVVVPGKLFSEICRKLPEGEVYLESKENQIEIQCSSSNTKMQMLPVNDFPSLPDVEDVTPFIIKQSALKNMIRRTLFAAATDESRPVLTGALLEINKDQFKVVALDGYRLAMNSFKLGDEYPDMKAIVPASSLNEIGRLMGDDDKAHVYINGAHMMVQIENTRIISRLLDGEFIKYEQILPTDWQTRIRVNAKELGKALDRASTMANQGNSNLVKFVMESNVLQINSESELGNVHEEVPVALEGKDLQIAFNIRYIVDVLKNMDAEEMYFCFTTSVSQCNIKPIEGDEFLYLVLPVRIYAQ